MAAAGLMMALLPAFGMAQSSAPAPSSAPTPSSAPAPSPAPAQASSPGGPGQPATAAPTQTSPSPASPSSTPASVSTASRSKDAKADKLPRATDRRRAAKLYLEASKLFEKEQFEEAIEKYRQAATLDPTNHNYPLAVELARSHEVTALIQAAAKDRIRGDAKAERAALQKALDLDPKNIQVTEHLRELGDDAVRGMTQPIYEKTADALGGSIEVEPAAGVHSFHLHADQRQVIHEVFMAYGIQATVDESSIHPKSVQLDLDDANFQQAMDAVSLVTNSFFVPLDAHRALVARDTADNRKQFERLDLETIYLPGLSTSEMTEVGTLAKNVFELDRAAVDPTAGTISVRATPTTLKAFNNTLAELIDGHSQVLLDVTMIQLAHTHELNTGVQPPQSISAFNVFAEEQSLLNSNSSLVQQIISSGLASPGNTLAILGILLASGQVSSSVFSNGAALFGGGITQSALSPGPLTANLNLNSSDSKTLDRMLLRMSDTPAGSSDDTWATVRSGEKYPIQTSSFSSLSPSVPNIPGLTGAGTSGSLSSLLSSLSSSVPNIPQVQYQDIGLTLKARTRVLRNNDVALTVDLKLDALSGSSLSGNPILTTQSYSGVVTLRQGDAVAVVSEMDSSEMRAISGLPGLSEVPGLNDVTDKDAQTNKATLLIIMTPHVIRGAQAAGHSPMMRVEHSTTSTTTAR
jgi:general secretion pathway protein D